MGLIGNLDRLKDVIYNGEELGVLKGRKDEKCDSYRRKWICGALFG